MRVRAADQLEAAVRFYLQVLAEQGVGHATAPGCVAGFDGGNREVAGAAAVAADAVGIGAVDRGAEVDSVGVVAALFAQGVEVVQQFRVQGVVIFQIELHTQANVLGQAAEARAAAQIALRYTVAEGDAAGGLELVAELVPGPEQLLVPGGLVRVMHARTPHFYRACHRGPCAGR